MSFGIPSATHAEILNWLEFVQVTTAAVSPCVRWPCHIQKTSFHIICPHPWHFTFFLPFFCDGPSVLKVRWDSRGGFQSIISLTHIYRVSLLQPCRWARTMKTKSVFSTVRFVRCWGKKTCRTVSGLPNVNLLMLLASLQFRFLNHQMVGG